MIDEIWKLNCFLMSRRELIAYGYISRRHTQANADWLGRERAQNGTHGTVSSRYFGNLRSSKIAAPRKMNARATATGSASAAVTVYDCITA